MSGRGLLTERGVHPRYARLPGITCRECWFIKLLHSTYARSTAVQILVRVDWSGRSLAGLPLPRSRWQIPVASALTMQTNGPRGSCAAGQIPLRAHDLDAGVNYSFGYLRVMFTSGNAAEKPEAAAAAEGPINAAIEAPARPLPTQTTRSLGDAGDLCVSGLPMSIAFGPDIGNAQKS